MSELKQCERCGDDAPRVARGDGVVIYESNYCLNCLPLVLAEDEEHDQAARRIEMLTKAGGGKSMHPWSLSTHPDRGAVAIAEEWLGDYRRGHQANLILFGNVGAGKSGLGWGIVRALVEDGYRALFLNFRDLLHDLRESFATKVPCTKFNRACMVSVLCLDDLGAERPTDWAREELATLIERRSTEGRPTIVTSNYAFDKLAERLGHDDPVIGLRIISRLAQDARQIHFTGKDLRL